MKNSVNLCTLIEQFGDESKCREYLEALRWRDGIKCPRCDHAETSKITTMPYLPQVPYNFSVTAGTIFNRFPFVLWWKWFLCTYLLCESEKGMSANQFKRALGVSYKTAWYLCHRVRAAMKEVNPAPLDGIGEIDETFVGGKKRIQAGDKGSSLRHQTARRRTAVLQS